MREVPVKLLAAALSSFLLFQPMLNALQQEQQNQKASIEGAVVRIGTGEPVAARVSLARVVIGPTGQPTVASPVGPTPNIPPGASVGAVVSSPPAAIPSVMTDSKGKFVFKDLDPGAYRITIAANGYARQEYGQRLLVGGQGTPIILAPART